MLEIIFSCKIMNASSINMYLKTFILIYGAENDKEILKAGTKLFVRTRSVYPKQRGNNYQRMSREKRLKGRGLVKFGHMRLDHRFPIQSGYLEVPIGYH